jgi:hypothetical protein
MKTLILSVPLVAFLLFNAFAQQPDLIAEAEVQYGQGSFASAHELYSRIEKTKMPPADLRWL